MNNQEVKKRYKQYKAGKHWVVAPIVFLGLFSTALLGSHESFAAETENPKTVESSVAQTDTPTSPTKETVGVSEGVNLEQTAPNTEVATEPQTVATDNTTPQKVGEQAPSKEENTSVQEQPRIEETAKSETGKVATPNSDVNTPEVTPTGNEALDNAVKEAQNNGVDVKEEPEKTVPSKEQADKDFKEQENKVKDTTNAQKEIDKTIKDAVDKAKENGVDVKETEKQKYKDQQKALEDAKKQAAALEEATKVMNEANKLIEEAINKAKQNGTPIKDDGVINATVKDAMEKAKQLVASIQAIDSENVEIKKRNAEALAKYQKAKAELDAKNAKIKAENEAIAKRNKERQDLYNKLLQEYLNGTKLETKMDARTQSYNEQQQYKTFMKSEVDQATGKFTLTHDMNDGVNIIGRGVLTGKINWLVTSNGDGSESVVINSIDLFKYIYTNLKPNSAVNKNIRFVVRDLQGNEIFRLNHDGERTISRDINKNVKYNNVNYSLKAGESTKMVEFLKVDDLWIYNTYGQVMIQFKNANEKPKTPDLEQEKPLDPTQLTPPTPEELKEAVSKKIVVTAETHPVQLQTAVHPVKVAEKPVTPPVTPMNTPSKPVKALEKLTVEKASVVPELPKTGEKENTFLSVLGAGMLVGLAWLGLKKREVK
ncbi:LPXTG cell wall anchor domain-containing protein [Enterococcus faecalis]|uniref:LPXTG cell wall anchor domain-containing protein n=1 Tax=Enterococcus faecalis TaxID=1351 RepID=UPI001BE04110|nr:LPXTG cell wall anchor domain-containing protein [Enterococcus faecalis]